MVLESLLAHDSEAQKLLKAHQHNFQFEFIKNSYSINVPSDESPDGFWHVSLKFSNENPEELCEAFCSCPEGDDCFHTLAAYFFLQQNILSSPVHETFPNSFWYHLFLEAFKEDLELTGSQELVFSCKNSDLALKISCQNQQSYQNFLNLLKKTSVSPTFLSAFPQQEVLAWKEGRPSIEMAFAASAFYFLAKKLFSIQLTESPLTIKENSDGFPFIFSIKTSDFLFEGEFYSKNLGEKLFRYILFSRTNLQYWPQNPVISNVTISHKPEVVHYTKCYDPIPEEVLAAPHLKIGPISYISRTGVILPLQESFSIPLTKLLTLPLSLKKQIFDFLSFDQQPTPLHYHMHFLKDATLEASAYFQEPGDLADAVTISKSLLYSPRYGLKTVTPSFEGKLNFFVKPDKIESFLKLHKKDLIEPGFQVFENKSFPGQLSYSVTDRGDLLFQHTLPSGVRIQEIPFGCWTYFEGFGFFADQSPHSAVKDGLIIEYNAVSDFIHTNEQELLQIPGFFSTKPFDSRLFLQLSFDSQTSSLIIKTICEGENPDSYKVFGDYLFKEDEGFVLIPKEYSFIKEYPSMIPPEGLVDFMTTSFNPDIFHVTDKTLTIPRTTSLIVKAIDRYGAGPLHLELSLDTDIGSTPIPLILNALKTKKHFLLSKSGFLNLNDCLYQLLASFLPENKHTKTALVASVTDIFKLDALAPLTLAPDVRATEKDLQFFSQLKDSCLPPLPKESFSVDHKLRPYQNSGLLWMWFLYSHQLSGLLCDEMGLGKTHQSVALLDLIFNLPEETTPTFLVVCPTSVLPHWEHILSTNVPKASVATFHGPERPSSLPETNIILTSYGTLRQNFNLFFKKQFTVAVFDEIHMAKNKNSQTHKVLARLDVRMKLGLTGTPVENNIAEFKNLMDIILPGYLPSDSLFKKLFSKKADKKNSEESSTSHDLLLKLTRPFILRRTKRHVLPDLPEKVESIVPCGLSSEQNALYNSVMKRDASYLKKLEEPEPEESSVYIHIFALLNHLKQICDHPSVFFKKPEDYKNHESGKWNMFTRILHENLQAGFKVVVFSQYINMIRIICSYLKEHGIKYASIQGKSLNRKEEIETFSNDPDCRVFVGSLLASGTGINLTAGNVVIMYDRWWNPAKENQALDRVHRIGQKNTVFIYKLMTSNTFEERINKLIESKTALLNSVILSHDSNILHMLNKEDLLTILSYKDDRQADETADSEQDF